MTTQSNPQPRWHLMQEALMRRPEAVVPTTIRLWEQLAPELISIIGEGGFEPIYARSLQQAAKQYPWMAKVVLLPPGIAHFTGLQDCLEAQDLIQATQASALLFTTFLDILASLIGEELTTHLLQVAWRLDTPESPAKESSTRVPKSAYGH